MKVRYIYSACVVIETDDIKICCDPWFTEGIYDGSWFHFPKISSSPLEIIGSVDFIYVSHIHPDHYDPIFLKDYLSMYPSAKVVIANFTNNFLSKKMHSDGIAHRIFEEPLKIGETEFKIIPNEMGSLSDVDSVLLVKSGKQSVVNLNDNPYNEDLLDEVLEFCPDIDIALLPYTGAGPYPQTYYEDEKILNIKSTDKKEEFFNRYLKLKEKLRPKLSIPFAGKYILGGNRCYLNSFRGVSDAVEVLSFDPSAVVLDDGGYSEVDVGSLCASSCRTIPYPEDLIKERISEILDRKMSYELFFQLPENAIQWKRLLPKSYLNALKYSEVESDFYFCIKFSHNEFFVVNSKKDSNFFIFAKDILELESYSPRSEIQIDYRYLFGLITCVFHWNNAEIGSHYFVNRVPDVFNRKSQSFLNFFHL